MNIDEEIAKAEKHLEDLKNKKMRSGEIALGFFKCLNEYTDAEKIEHFDKLHEFAYSIVQQKIDGDYHEDNDDDHYAYEAVMFILARDPESFWTSHNKFFK